MVGGRQHSTLARVTVRAEAGRAGGSLLSFAKDREEECRSVISEQWKRIGRSRLLEREKKGIRIWRYRWVEGSRIGAKGNEWNGDSGTGFRRMELQQEWEVWRQARKPDSDSNWSCHSPSTLDASRRLARGPQRALGGVGGID